MKFENPHYNPKKDNLYFYYLSISNDMHTAAHTRAEELYDEYIETKDGIAQKKKYHHGWGWFLDILVRNCKDDLVYQRNMMEIHIRKAKKDDRASAVDLLEKTYEDLIDIESKGFMYILKWLARKFDLGKSAKRIIKENKFSEKLTTEVLKELLKEKQLDN